MTAIRFCTDWQDGEGIEGDELSSTFASLRVDVRGEPLTHVIDNRAQTTRDSIFVPLYPVAEWLVANWWFIKHESENPRKATDPAFSRRHSWGTATDGYALPDLTIATSGSRAHLTWRRTSASWPRIEFLSEGHATVDREQFMQDCADFIDKVIRRLLARGIESTFLQDEWTAIRTADEEESGFCSLSAGLGWDPYDLDEAMRGHVVTLADQLGPLSSEAVHAIDASAPLNDCSAILAAIEDARPNELRLPSLPLMTRGGFNEKTPWSVGYDLARRARSEFGLDGRPVRNTEHLAEALGQSVETLQRATGPVAPLERLALVDGVVTRGAEGGASFGLKTRGQIARRFLFCRALAEAISGRGDALVTRGNTERQQCNRAFAAEFLAPSTSLGKKISTPVVDEEQVDDLAEEFGVSPWVISHQIENHELARVA